MQGHYEG